MVNSTIDSVQIDNETLKLLKSMFDLGASNPFHTHVEYNNFKLNDSKYLDALGLIKNKNIFMHLVQEFTTHYEHEIKNPDSQHKFKKLSDLGNTKNVTSFKPFPISFYLGLNTKFPEIFMTPEVSHYFDRDTQYGLDISYYIKYGEFRENSYAYMALTNTTRNNNILDHVLKCNGNYNDYYEKLNGLIYTKDILAIPNHYMRDILEEIDPETFTNEQKAQFISNVYRYSLRFETETSTLAERTRYMNKYCGEMKEWESIKTQIIILNQLTDITFKNKEIVLSFLTKIDNSVDLPQIEFNA